MGPWRTKNPMKIIKCCGDGAFWSVLVWDKKCGFIWAKMLYTMFTDNIRKEENPKKYCEFAQFEYII